MDLTAIDLNNIGTQIKLAVAAIFSIQFVGFAAFILVNYIRKKVQDAANKRIDKLVSQLKDNSTLAEVAKRIDITEALGIIKNEPTPSNEPTLSSSNSDPDSKPPVVRNS